MAETRRVNEAGNEDAALCRPSAWRVYAAAHATRSRRSPTTDLAFQKHACTRRPCNDPLAPGPERAAAASRPADALQHLRGGRGRGNALQSAGAPVARNRDVMFGFFERGASLVHELPNTRRPRAGLGRTGMDGGQLSKQTRRRSEVALTPKQGLNIKSVGRSTQETCSSLYYIRSFFPLSAITVADADRAHRRRLTSLFFEHGRQRTTGLLSPRAVSNNDTEMPRRQVARNLNNHAKKNNNK